MQANPRISKLTLNPDTGRGIEAHGEMEMTDERALEHLDELTRQYTRHDHYYGGIFPLERQSQETRIICQIRPNKITLDAIHK